MKWITASVLLFFFASCDSDRMPADVLPREKMEQVLWDLLQADELAYQEFPEDSAARRKASVKYYSQVFHVNGISEEVFNKSYNWYADHPASLNKVLDSLRNRSASPPPPATPKPRKRLKELIQ